MLRRHAKTDREGVGGGEEGEGLTIQRLHVLSMMF